MLGVDFDRLPAEITIQKVFERLGQRAQPPSLFMVTSANSGLCRCRRTAACGGD
ncbi:MAG: hypothetical protein ACOX1P_04400 [Thermoguttaceae bacterium]